MSLLVYRERYGVFSQVAVQSSLITLVDDSEAVVEFSLSTAGVALVVYNPHATYNSGGVIQGINYAISVDGTDRAKAGHAIGNGVSRGQTFWVGALGAGSHTIKGRFSSNQGGTNVTISQRALEVFVFDGDEYGYVESETLFTTTSTSFVDDPNASLNVSASGACKAVYLYSACNQLADTEYFYGKKVAISVAGADYSQCEQGTKLSGGLAGCFSCYAESRGAGAVAVKGRVAAQDTSGCSVRWRQLGVLLVDDATLLDYLASDVQVSTSSNVLVDDGQASSSRQISETRDYLILGFGTKREGTASSTNGECYGVRLGAVDLCWSRSNDYSTNHGVSCPCCRGGQAVAGNYAIQGRFSNNTGTETAKIDSRRIIVLWFTVPAPPPAGWRVERGSLRGEVRGSLRRVM